MDFVKKHNNVLISIIIVLFAIVDIVGLFSLYQSYNDIIETNITAVTYLKDIKSYMDNIDNNILYSINEINASTDSGQSVDVSEYTNKVDYYLDKCHTTMEDYVSLSDNDIIKSRYTLFSYYFESYENNINNMISNLNSQNVDNVESTYNLQLLPIRNCTNELLNALDDLTNARKDTRILHAASYGLALGIAIFCVSILMLVVLNTLHAIQQRAMHQLEKDTKTIAKQRDTINTTVFNDILTDVNNRMAFINTYGKGKVTINENQAYYFIMFNIDNFNAVNINYGSNSGDMVLSSTADRLKKCFAGSEVYRTGSDEFVVVMKEVAGNEGYTKAINYINTARMTLAQPHSIGTGILSVMYSVSLVKKTGPNEIDSSVIEILKDAMNRGRLSQTNTVSFIDLDFLVNNNTTNI
jgi:diguanylate cyclase (GGDEF)-like protein